MTTATGSDASAAPNSLTSVDERAVKDLAAFAGAGKSAATAVVAHLGRSGARIVVIAVDGRFADAVVSSVAAAATVCERAGITVGQWSREVTAKITPRPADRVKMRGTGR